MKIQDANQQVIDDIQKLTGLLKSDDEVIDFRNTQVETHKKEGRLYLGMLMFFVLIVVACIILDTKTNSIISTSIAPSSLLFSYYIFKKLEKNSKKISFILDITAPISTSNRCTEILNLIETHSEAKQISDQAISKGRQLYKFDADLMIETVNNKMRASLNTQESEACKKIHSLIL